MLSSLPGFRQVASRRSTWQYLRPRTTLRQRTDTRQYPSQLTPSEWVLIRDAGHCNHPSLWGLVTSSLHLVAMDTAPLTSRTHYLSVILLVIQHPVERLPVRDTVSEGILRRSADLLRRHLVQTPSLRTLVPRLYSRPGPYQNPELQ